MVASLSFRLIESSSKQTGYSNEPEVIAFHKNYSYKKALITGFLTNTLNPKASLFFLSLFMQVISPNTPLLIQSLYGLEMMIMTTLWFSGIALFFSYKKFKVTIFTYKYIVGRIFGTGLITFGVKIATSAKE